MNCPTCKRRIVAVEPRPATLPFCSERCRAADLGSWLNESYRLSSGASDDELDTGSPVSDADDLAQN